MRRFVCLLLCVAMLMEFCPLDALAAGSIVSDSFIEAAWALSGQDPGAAHWHRGMEPESTWNAEQLDEWLDYVLSEPVYAVHNAHTNLKLSLAKLEQNDPAAYSHFMSANNGLYMNYMTDVSHQVEDLRQKLRACKTIFVMNGDKIATMIDLIRGDATSERNRIRYSNQLQTAVNAIRETRAAVVQNYRAWLDQLEAWHGDFRGGNAANGSAPMSENGIDSAGLNEWVRSIMSIHEAPVRTAVSVDAQPNGRQNSLLSKLNVAESALNAQETDTQYVDVIPDTQFVVYLSTPVEQVEANPDPEATAAPAPSPMPVQNGSVKVWDAKDIQHPDTDNPYTTTAPSDEYGNATFNVSEFTVNDDGIMRLGILANAEGYQQAEYYVAEVTKGGLYAVSLTPKDGHAQEANGTAPWMTPNATSASNDSAADEAPHAYHVDFNHMDALNIEAQIFYSPLNDVEHDINICVSYPDNYSGSRDVTLNYYDITKVHEGKAVEGEWKTMTLGYKDTTLDSMSENHGLRYTFTDKWKQILGPGKKISFHIGDESSGVDVNNVKLTVKRGHVDQPLSDSGTGALTGITKTLGDVGNLFALTLPSDVVKPLGGSKLELNIPVLQYLPKIGYNLDGSITVAYGIDPGSIIDHSAPSAPPQEGDPPQEPVEHHWYDDHTWKTRDQRGIDEDAANAEKQATSAKYSAKVGTMWDGVKQKSFNFLGSWTLSMGAFGMITGQFGGKNEYKEGDDDNTTDMAWYHNCRNLSLTLGAIATFTVGATAQFSAIGYMSIDLSASLAIGLTISGEWNNFDPENSNFGSVQWGGTSGLTVLIKVMISVTLGVGIKGLISLGITGYGYISILIRWDVSSGVIPDLIVSAGAGVQAFVQLLFLKYTMDIWQMPETVLYDSHTDNSDTAFNMMDIFMARAVAEAGDDQPEPMTPQEPECYPALVPTATRVMDDETMSGSKVKIVDVNGTPFAFYITKTTTRDGAAVDRLTWQNLNTGKTGTLQETLEEIHDSQLYYRVSYNHSGNGGTPINPCVLSDYSFDVKISGNQYVGISVLSASGFEEEAGDRDPSSGNAAVIRAPKDSTAWFVAMIPDSDGLKVVTRDTYQWLGFMKVGYGTLYAFSFGEMDLICGEIDLFSFQGKFNEIWGDYDFSAQYVVHKYIPQDTDGDPVTDETICVRHDFELHEIFSDQWRSTKTVRDSAIPLLSGYTLRSQLSGGCIQLSVHDGTFVDEYVAWYCLESAEDGPHALVHGIDDGDRVPVAISGEGDDVLCYRVVQWGNFGYNKSTDTIFYIAGEKDTEGKEHHWLKGAVVTSDETRGAWMGVGTEQYTITDYDVDIGASSFNVQNIDGADYIYWLSTAPKEEKTDPDVYRIKTVIYDPSSDTMSNEMVLAEFSMPDANQVPANVYLREDGTGYCTAVVGDDDDLRSDVFSFPINWVTSLELNAMTLSETHAHPAGWVDTVVSVMNSGNTAITAFDLELFTRDNDGAETVVETLHCDCLTPKNSGVYLGEGEDGTKVSDGDHTILRLADPVEPMRKSDHNIKKYTWEYNKDITTQPDQYADSPSLLPGAVKTYSIPLYIPADWSGEKALFLRVYQTGARANWMAADTAAANGLSEGEAVSNGRPSKALSAALDTRQNPEIIYTRAADGTMVRTDHLSDLLAANGNGTGEAVSFSPRYPDRVMGSKPLRLNHDIHDLKVTHRVWQDANGFEYVSITFMNRAETGRVLTLNACIYMDDDETPLEVALPYYPDQTTGELTHTVTLRMDALLGGRHPRTARVVLEPDGIEETALRNNQFSLHFDDDEVNDPLRFAAQPAPVSALPGEAVRFTIQEAGGVKPYTRRWQVWMGEKRGWKDIPDSDSSTLTVENVTPAMHGRKARCIVTDHYLNVIVSDEAMLNVMGAGGRDLPETGDDTNLPLYIAVALIALALLWWMRRRGKTR